MAFFLLVHTFFLVQLLLLALSRYQHRSNSNTSILIVCNALVKNFAVRLWNCICLSLCNRESHSPQAQTLEVELALSRRQTAQATCVTLSTHSIILHMNLTWSVLSCLLSRVGWCKPIFSDYVHLNISVEWLADLWLCSHKWCINSLSFSCNDWHCSFDNYMRLREWQ